MTYFDVHGVVGQGPTLHGLRQFHEWAAPYPATKNFLDNGETVDHVTVADEMRRTTVMNPDLEEIRTALIAAADRADLVLILSDE